MMYIHSKYDNMHKDGIIYALNGTNNHVTLSISYVLLVIRPYY